MTYRSGLLPNLFERELLGYKRSYAPNHFSHAFTCQGQHAGVIRVDPDGDPCPPYAVAYNQVVNGCRFLTVGDEEGSVSILDTQSDKLPSSLYTDHNNPPRAKWLAHNNAIFDVAWAKNDSILYTASGDQHVGVWDTTAGRLLLYCAGHVGSVKAVCPHSVQPDMFASGSRDGGILLWDLRSPSRWSAAKRRMHLSPVMRIDIATAPGQQYRQGPPPAVAAGLGSSRSTPGSGKKQSKITPGQCRRSVTSLLFVHNEHTMISSSDMDGVVKLWDLRKLTRPSGDITLPPAATGRQTGGRGSRTALKQGAAGCLDDCEGVSWLGFTCPSRSTRSAGITNMALSPAGGLLLVSSIDSCHYLYRLSGLHQPPLACLTGHRTNSFCIKSCFSPSGDHVLSGSSDKKAYIWEVAQPSAPPVCLSGHSGEVTAVAWCPADHCHITTAADDASVRIWSMDRADSRYERDFEQANIVLPFAASAGCDQKQGLCQRYGLAGEGSTRIMQQELVDTDKRQTAATAAVLSPGSVVTSGGATAVKSVKAVCSPLTPQLPGWRNAAAVGEATTAAASGQQQVTVTDTPSAANNATAAEWCRTPGINSQQAAAAAVTPRPPLPPSYPTPPAAAVQLTTPRLRQTTIQQQLSAAAAHKQAAAAAAQPTLLAGDSRPLLAQQGDRTTPCSNQQHSAGSDGLAQQTEQQHQQQHTSPVMQQPTAVQAATPPGSADGCPAQHGGTHPAASGDCALLTANVGDALPLGQQQQNIADWMNTLTPSPVSSPKPPPPQQQQQQQLDRVSFRRGGVVELVSPWDLPSPVRQQRQHEQAVLEAQQLQQSQLRLTRLTLQEGGRCPDSSSSQPDEGTGDDDVGVGVNCCRLLQDEFEVYCDGGSSPTAAGLVSPGSDVTQRSLSRQENKTVLQQQQQQQRGMGPEDSEAAAAVGGPGPNVLLVPQVDIDMVPSSLPLTQPSTQQQQQQQSSQQLPDCDQVQGVRSPARPAVQPPACPAAAGEVELLPSSGMKPGAAALLSGGQRTPLADLSKLLPADQDVLSPPAQLTRRFTGSPAAAAAESPARRLAAGRGAADSPLLRMLLHSGKACDHHQAVKNTHDSPERLLDFCAAAGGEGPTSPVMHHSSSPAGRKLSRLGDRQISPLPAAAAQLMPAVQQQRQQHGHEGGVACMLYASRDVCTGEQQRPAQQQLLLSASYQHQEGQDEAGATTGAQQQQQLPGSSAGTKHGGIKRAYVANVKDRKKQCTLSALWVKEPQVEDAASRFSGF